MSVRTTVAVVGLGRMGQIHLRHLVFSCRANVKYLIDIDQSHSMIQKLVEKYSLGDVKIINPDGLEEMLNDKDVTAVLICTPVQGKAELVKRILKGGKHVFCEKPIAIEENNVSDCYKVAENCVKVLQCGFDKRFDVSVRSIYNQIRKGEIGTLRMIKLTARELLSHTTKEYIKSSGGLHIDSMIHEYDLMCWLAGEKPNSVSSFGHAHFKHFAECDDVDGAVVILKFPSGLMGFIESFRGAPYGYDQRFEVLGTDGMLLVENPKVTLVGKWTEQGHISDNFWDGLGRYIEAYRDELLHFLDVMEAKTTCEVKADEVIFVTKLVTCAFKAMKSGETVTIT